MAALLAMQDEEEIERIEASKYLTYTGFEIAVNCNKLQLLRRYQPTELALR